MLKSTAAVLTGLAVLLVRAAIAAVAEEVALQLDWDAALVTAGELRLPTRPRSSGHHLCFRHTASVEKDNSKPNSCSIKYSSANMLLLVSKYVVVEDDSSEM